MTYLAFIIVIFALFFLVLRVGSVLLFRLLGVFWELIVHVLIVEPVHYWDHYVHAKQYKKPNDPVSNTENQPHLTHLDWNGDKVPWDHHSF
jgi:hypothetical protein